MAAHRGDMLPPLGPYHRRIFHPGGLFEAPSGLRYDLLVFAEHLPQTIEFVDRRPNLVFILDHIAKPKISAGELEPWRARIVDLAKRPNVYCKISGMAGPASASCSSLFCKTPGS